jgi:predicted HTH transcriptional regulator
VGIQGKFVANITRDDIRELVQTRAPEDILVDFKQIVFHPRHKKPNEEIDDLLADVAAFANAFGGHIVVGIEDRDDRAWQLRPIPIVEARKIATKLKALAIQYLKPPVIPLEIVPFSMSDQADEWIVIIRIPEGQAKPHMSSFSKQTKFVIRDGHAKRHLSADEIREAFLSGPQQSTLANMDRELRAVRALIEENVRQARPWWKFW